MNHSNVITESQLVTFLKTNKEDNFCIFVEFEEEKENQNLRDKKE